MKTKPKGETIGTFLFLDHDWGGLGGSQVQSYIVERKLNGQAPLTLPKLFNPLAPIGMSPTRGAQKGSRRNACFALSGRCSSRKFRSQCDALGCNVAAPFGAKSNQRNIRT